MLRRLIDTNDHMYIENLAVDKSNVPLFVNVSGGGGFTPFCHPICIYYAFLTRYLVFINFFIQFTEVMFVRNSCGGYVCALARVI